jgi:hypothetical protein
MHLCCTLFTVILYVMFASLHVACLILYVVVSIFDSIALFCLLIGESHIFCLLYYAQSIDVLSLEYLSLSFFILRFLFYYITLNGHFLTFHFHHCCKNWSFAVTARNLIVTIFYVKT